MEKLRKWLPSLLIFAVLLASLAGGAVYAKYVTQKQFDGSVIITANLGTITLLEHKAERNADGSYRLLETTTDKNEYIIIPGLDIPKDPFVTVDKQSPIPVYVFVEVVSKLDGSAVSCEVDEYHATINPSGKWIKIGGDSYKGKNGGTVYVYTGGGAVPKQITNEDFTAYILKDNLVAVGQKLNAKEKIQANLGLTFHACMGEVAAGKDGSGNISTTGVYDNAK